MGRVSPRALARQLVDSEDGSAFRFEEECRGRPDRKARCLYARLTELRHGGGYGSAEIYEVTSPDDNCRRSSTIW